MAPPPTSARRVVVDGSNLATEGRNLPSLAQLDEAVRAFADERPDDEIIVVVDASFGYRIDESERKVFEEAEDAGEIVSPPAGAIGRGDGFLLRIADRIDADVLSNDSFQEFHGEYTWLFDEGRLIGGKPVPGVGWIFTPRTPVRGPKSRVATRDADRARKRVASASSAAAAAKPANKGPTADAIAQATAEAIAPDAPKPAKRGSRRRSRVTVPDDAAAPEAINEPLPFITFIAGHPLGTEVEGTVDSFTSHGAFVTADGARCYAPVSGLGDPPPRSAKEVLKKGDVRTFVIQALDPPRRGIELALPGIAKVAGAPTDETVEAEIDAGSHPGPAPDEPGATPVSDGAAAAEAGAPPVGPARPRRRRAAGAGAITTPSPGPAPARAAEPEPPVAESPQPAPSRRPRRGRVAAAAPAPADAPVAEPPAPAAEDAAGGPPRPARPRRSPARAAAGPPPAVEVAPAEPEPAPARRSRKKAAAVVAAPPVVAEARPPQKATRSRKKAAPAEQPAPVEAEVAAPVKKRAAKKAAPPVDEPVKKARKAAAKKVSAPDDAAPPVAKKVPARKVAARKASPASE